MNPEKQITIEDLKEEMIKRYERMLRDEQFHLNLLCQFNSEFSKKLQESSIATIDILMDNINAIKKL